MLQLWTVDTQLWGERLQMYAIFDPAYSVSVGAWGFLVGLVGLFLTVVGFGISIIQIRQAKSAADAARDAVFDVQVRVNRYDAAVDLAEARSSLHNARHYANLDAWPQFVSSYEIVSEALGRVALQAFATDDKVSENIKKSRSRIAKSCHAIEKHLEGAGPPPIRSEISKSIRIEMSIVQDVEQKNWKGAIL